MRWRHFAAVLWIGALLSALALLGLRLASGVTLESNILALLPRQERDPTVQHASDQLAAGMSRQFAILVQTGSQERTITIAKQLSAALLRAGVVAHIDSSVDPDAQRRIGAALFPHRAGLLSEADRNALLSGDGESLKSRALGMMFGLGGFGDPKLLARDPFFLLPNYLLALPSGQSRLSVEDGVLIGHNAGKTFSLISGTLNGPPYALDFQKRFNQSYGVIVAQLKQQVPDLTLLRSGAIFYAHDAAQEALNETSIIGAVSLLGTLALIFTVFGGLRPIILDSFAVGAGIGCAFLGTLLIFGQVHVLALLFGVSLIGISVDYSLQYFCEYFDSEAPDSVARLRRVLPGLAIGLTTTLIGYCTLLLAPFPGLRQVATFSLIGLTVSCLTVIICYPLFDRNVGPRSRSFFVRLADVHWRFWESKVLLPLRVLLIVSLCGVALWGSTKLTTDDDVHHFQTMSAELRNEEAALLRLTGSSAAMQFVLVHAPSENLVLEAEEHLSSPLAALKKSGAIDDYVALSQFVPSPARQKQNRALNEERLVKPYLAGYLEEIGYTGAIEYPQNDNIMHVSDLPKTGPYALVRLLNIPAGLEAMNIIQLRGVNDAGAVRAAVADVPGLRFISLADDWTALFAKYRIYALSLLALSVALMYPLLAWRYGFVRALRVLAPSLLAVLLTPMITAALAVPFTFFNAMALVLVLSVGVDYSVFCAETIGNRKPVTALGIMLAAAGTLMAFGMLALSQVFAVHAFGMTMLVGILIAYLFAPLAGHAAARKVMS